MLIPYTLQSLSLERIWNMKKTLFINCSLLCLVILFGNGCNGVAVKYGNYNISDSYIKEGMDNDNYWAIEGTTESFWNDKADLNFGIGILDGPDAGELPTNMGTISVESITLGDFYGTMRYYPLGERTDLGFPIKPYIGAGIGYFRLIKKTRSQGDYIGGINYGTWGYSYYEIDEKSDTMAEGFYPHFVLGTYIPIGKSGWSFSIEDRIDIGKEDNGFDFSGNILMFGLHFGYRY